MATNRYDFLFGGVGDEENILKLIIVMVSGIY